MPQRSKVHTLPDDVKALLDRRLISGGFSDYTALSQWLADQGYEISRSSLHRYGSDFEARLGAIKIASEQARAVVEAAGDDAGDMTDALIRLVQQECFTVLMQLGEEDKSKLLPKIGIMVAKLSRAAVDQKKWMAEVREKAEKAVETVEKRLEKSTIDAETLRKVREDIYGIVG